MVNSHINTIQREQWSASKILGFQLYNKSSSCLYKLSFLNICGKENKCIKITKPWQQVRWSYLHQPIMGPRSFLATVTLFLASGTQVSPSTSFLVLVVTCVEGGERGESVSVPESSVRHGNQLTWGCLCASVFLSVTLGFWPSSTVVHVQLSWASCEDRHWLFCEYKQ